MVRILKGLVLLPLAVIVILLAVANHQPTTLSLDPFSPEPAFSLVLPLYGIVLAALAIGIVVGGAGAWIGQGKARRSARHHRIERERLEREVAQAKVTARPTSAGDPYRIGSALPAIR